MLAVATGAGRGGGRSTVAFWGIGSGELAGSLADGGRSPSDPVPEPPGRVTGAP